MSFNPCAIIPIYNHGTTITTVVKALESYGLKCFIIDDGSDQATRLTLDELVKNHPQVHLLRFSQNQGKGVAVLAGFKAAYQAGFTHGLQIDADGQHNLNDIEKLIELGKQLPLNLISGAPIYDESIPKARLYGRYITHFWVWIETLSFHIKDSMCGFRLYPLAASCELISKTHIGTHMDFDTEIMVKLFWQGVKVTHLPTKVIYPQNGLSNFRALADNIAISKMHTRLFLGMLWRSPMIIGRRLFKSNVDNISVSAKNNHWSKTSERGSHLGLAIMLRAYRLLGRRFFMLLLYPLIAYFFITGKSARQQSQKFLKRAYQTNSSAFKRAPKFFDSFRHFMSFGQASIDKLSSWMGDISPKSLTFDGKKAFDEVVRSNQGAVFIGSHLGNIELGRALSKHESSLVINAIVFSDNAENFTNELKRANPDYDLNLIQISTLGPDMAMRLKEKVEQGEILVIVGDRTSTSVEGRVCYAPFMGELAPFPQGPFIIASLMDCPIYLMFCMQQDKEYRVYFEVFEKSAIRLPRRNREQVLQNLVQRYAQRLQHYALKYPFQWFNFFDFWQGDKAQRILHKTPNQSPSKSVDE